MSRVDSERNGQVILPIYHLFSTRAAWGMQFGGKTTVILLCGTIFIIPGDVALVQLAGLTHTVAAL
jgi:hypothetical protein